jgi:hypothetical protein
MPFSRASQFKALFTLLAGGRLVEPFKVGSNGAVAGRDHLEGPIHGLGYLPQGRRPVPPLVFGQLRRSEDHGDGIGERGLDQGGHLRHWERYLDDDDGLGLPQVDRGHS